MSGVVIIGAGECGVRAAFTLRDEGFDGKIKLFGEENNLPYERPPLSKGSEDGHKLLRTKEAYSEADIDLQLGSRVSSIDAACKSVMLEDGSAVSYDKLLIATGARPRLFDTMNGCLCLRTDLDAAKIFGKIGENTSIGIIGGGFIGLELAAIARQAGAKVTLIEAAPRLMGRAVPGEIADLVQARHESEGVRILTGQAVAAASQTSITLEGGETLEFDAVIAGVGSVPNTDLAEAAGLEVDNGIVVDMAFKTSDPHIFAAGDCCNFEWRGKRVRLESWKAAQDQGAHVAMAMLGETEAYAKVPWFWSDQYDQTLQVAGLFDAAHQTHQRETDGETTLVFQCDGEGRICAAAGIGTGNAIAKDIRILEKLMERQAVIEPSVIADPSTSLKSLLKAR